jgi:hypothetical protein
MKHPRAYALTPLCTPEHVGFLPTFLDEDDPRPAGEQFQERYVYGGWHPQDGFTESTQQRFWLQYPGDPPLPPIAVMRLRDEMIFVYQHAYVAIFQPDGSFEACRMD